MDVFIFFMLHYIFLIFYGNYSFLFRLSSIFLRSLHYSFGVGNITWAMQTRCNLSLVYIFFFSLFHYPCPHFSSPLATYYEARNTPNMASTLLPVLIPHTFLLPRCTRHLFPTQKPPNSSFELHSAASLQPASSRPPPSTLFLHRCLRYAVTILGWFASASPHSVGRACLVHLC